MITSLVDVRMEECTGARQRMRLAWHVAETPHWTWQVRACCYTFLMQTKGPPFVAPCKNEIRKKDHGSIT
jgi:hypothetical protein